MSAHGAPTPHLNTLSFSDRQPPSVAVIAACWHEQVMEGLLQGALRALDEAGVREPLIVRVPGSFELPVAASRLARQHQALVALGVVIRGGTPHFDYVCQAATIGLTQVSVQTGIPIGFGVLTCDDEAQAIDRAGLAGSQHDKGYEAAAAALQTAALLCDAQVPSAGAAS